MKSKKVFSAVIFSVLLVLCISVMFASAHGGKTDSRGGHRDNNNVSGLGSYHYHCGGHPAHLHTNGACPYAVAVKKTVTKAPTTAAETTTKTTTTKTTTTTTTTTTATTATESTTSSEQTNSEERTSVSVNKSQTKSVIAAIGIIGSIIVALVIVFVKTKNNRA